MPSRHEVIERRKTASDNRFRKRAGYGGLPSISKLYGNSHLTSLNEVVKPQNLLLKEGIFKLEDYSLPRLLAYELSRNGIHVVGDLVEKTEKQLLEFRGFGKARQNHSSSRYSKA
jgi:hypothetical protein